MTTTTDPVEEMAAHLRAAKDQTGLSYKQLERAAVRLLGDDDAPTHETIRSYHQGTISAERINDRLVLALCRIYNRPVAEVAPRVAKRLQVVRSLLDEDGPQSRWITIPAGQDRRRGQAFPGIGWDGTERRLNTAPPIDLTSRRHVVVELPLAS